MDGHRIAQIYLTKGVSGVPGGYDFLTGSRVVDATFMKSVMFKGNIIVMVDRIDTVDDMSRIQ